MIRSSTALAVLLVLSGQALAQEDSFEPTFAPERSIRTLNVAVLDDAPGFSTEGRFGARRGFDIDFALALCDRLSARCALRPMETAEMQAELDARSVDFVVASEVAAGLNGASLVASLPYLILPIRIVLPESAVLPAPGEPFSGQFAAQNGTPQAALARQTYPGRVAIYANTDEMWIDLALRRLFGVFAPALAAQAEFLATPLGEGFHAVAPPESAAEGTRPAVVVLRDRDRELLTAINGAISAIIEEQELAGSIAEHLDPALVEIPQQDNLSAQ